MSDSKTQMIGAREAVRELGCSRRYLYDLLAENKLPGAVKHGKEWQIPLASLKARVKGMRIKNETK